MKHMLVESAHDHWIRLGLPLDVILPDGQQIHAASDQKLLPPLKIKSWNVLSDLVLGELGTIGTHLVEGRLQFDGTMRQLIEIAKQILQTEPHLHHPNALKKMWEATTQRLKKTLTNNRFTDARNVRSHYDLSDQFYEIWLDPLRVYSCAYFSDQDTQLEEAQRAKLDLICRKLMLREGERFLDVGMGWGGLILWAAEKYGVKSTGITLSKNQYAHVVKQIHERNLAKQVEIHLMDYRDLNECQPFDKLASVGMFEHVGRLNMKTYFAKIWRLLKPGGIFMNHGITAGGIGYHQIELGIGDFIESYIFPGGELLHVSDVIRDMSLAGFELVDAENLRPHYAQTLWAWSDRLEGRLEDAMHVLEKEQGSSASKILQAYRLYLAGCAFGFERGWTLLYQLLAIRPDGPSSYPYKRQNLFVTETNQHSP